MSEGVGMGLLLVLTITVYAAMATAVLGYFWKVFMAHHMKNDEEKDNG